MKKTLLFAFLLVAVKYNFAQITLSSSDFPSAGWINALGKDTAVGVVNFGNKGINQVYDFSQFTADKADTVFYKTMTGTQQTKVPNGNLAATSNNVDFIFFNKNSTNYSIEGLEGDLLGLHSFIPFSTPSIQNQFTTQYNGKFGGTASFTKTELGANFNPPLPVYQIRATNNTTYKDTIDGWGKVKTPVGTYACLRQKRVEYSTTQIDVQLSQIIPTWTSYQTIKDTTIRYYYLTKESKGNIISFTYDSLDKPLTASWSKALPTAPIAAFRDTFTGNKTFSFFDLSQNYPDTWAWDFGDGTTSNLQNPNHSYTASGSYIVCLTVSNAGGSSTICDTIIVANHAPTAINDTASTYNGSSITSNVGLNDHDIDSDNFCITALIGNSHFQIAAMGNCTSITYTADSTFAGKDTCYYVICDNGSPNLCDTGMYVVNVTCIETFNPFSFNWSDTTYFNNTHLLLPSFFINFYANNQKADSVVWTFTNLDNMNTLSITRKNIAVSFSFSGPFIVDSTVYILPMIKTLFCATAYFPCGIKTACDTIIFLPEGISEIGVTTIKTYPNPTNQHLVIDLSEMEAQDRNEIAYFSLYNVLGAEVMRVSSANQLQQTISLVNISNGIYQLVLTDKSNSKKAVSKIQVLK